MLCLQTIVIKIGSAVLSNPDKSLNEQVLTHLAKQIAKLFEEGHRILIVSSGAVASGRGIRDFSDEKRRQVRRQMYAGIGQAKLLWKYQQVFSAHEIPIAQALITRDNFADQLEHANLITTLEGYLRFRVIPILNENDVISNRGVNFGGNDFLAALTAVSIKADKLIMLSDVDCLYDKDPRSQSDAKPIAQVEKISAEIMAMAGASSSAVGLGGMVSKLQAIKIATEAGIKTFLANGTAPNILGKIVDTREIVGTYFKPLHNAKAHRFKHWLRYCSLPKGHMTLDDGAVQAVRNRKSLLLVGVKDISPGFGANDAVLLLSLKGEPVGIGRPKYGSERIRAAIESKENLGLIIHADQLGVHE